MSIIGLVIVFTVQAANVSSGNNGGVNENCQNVVRAEVAALKETMDKEIRQLRAELRAAIGQKERVRRNERSIITRCPNGFVSHDTSCYKASNVVASWAEAMVYCEAYGGSLARTESDTEYNFLNNYIKQQNAVIKSGYYWVDGLDALVEGEWIWAKTLEPVIYKKWAVGEPDSSTTTSNCMAFDGHIQADYVFDDGSCEIKHPFICEVRLDVESEIVG